MKMAELLQPRGRTQEVSVKVRILGLVLLVGLVSRPALATSVSIQPATSAVTQGDTFTVDIAITGAADLVAYQFDLTFDPAVLAATDVTMGPFLTSGGGSSIFVPGDFTTTPGVISGTAETLVGGTTPGVSGGGVLAHISFSAIAAGTSALTLSNDFFLKLLRDANGDLVMDTDDQSPFFGDFIVDPDLVPITFQDGSATVIAAPPSAEVPEPSTVVLLGAGLVAAVRRRRANRAA